MSRDRRRLINIIYQLRRFLTMTSMTYITLICLAFVGTATAGDWTYGDVSKWNLKNPACGNKAQSPINIKTIDAKSESIKPFDINKYTLQKGRTFENNGHTLQLSLDESMLSGGGLKNGYKALQLHFHWSAKQTNKGSEHALNSVNYPVEMHIVHMNSMYATVGEALTKADGLAVLGFFFQIDADNKDNKYLNPLINGIDTLSDTKKNMTTIKEFDLKSLISTATKANKFYRYNGSLTTPPCSEAVIWSVYDDTLSISQTQLSKIWSVTDTHGEEMKNYRPIQELNKRSVHKSFNSGMMIKSFSVLIALSVSLSFLS